MRADFESARGVQFPLPFNLKKKKELNTRSEVSPSLFLILYKFLNYFFPGYNISWDFLTWDLVKAKN